MVWHIKKTSILGSDTVYYKGNNCWTENFEERSTYTSQAKAKEVDYIWEEVNGMLLLSMKDNEKFC